MSDELRGQIVALRERADKAERAIAEHNAGCDAACGKTTTYEYVRDARRCDPRRDCPDCPRDWRIEP
jgi:hypothetical protein